MQVCEKERIKQKKKRKSESSRDLIDVWGLPHLNKVIIRHKEIEFLLGI